MTAILVGIIKDPIVGLDLLAMLFTVFYLGKLAFADFVSLESENDDGEDINPAKLEESFRVGSFISLPKFALEKQRMLVELRA